MSNLLKSPYRSPIAPRITQEFGSKANLSWYLSNNVILPFHNGIDVVFGNSRQTYGVECICPFPTAKVVKVTWDTPTTTKGNGVTIEANYNGHIYQLVFWHTGEIKVTLGQQLKQGDVICYVGNSGLCNPAPSKKAPWDGAHSHFMLFRFDWITKPYGSQWVLQDADNGVGGARDPRELFDFTLYETGVDTGLSHDMWVLKQYVDKMTPQEVVNYFKLIKL